MCNRSSHAAASAVTQQSAGCQPTHRAAPAAAPAVHTYSLLSLYAPALFLSHFEVIWYR